MKTFAQKQLEQKGRDYDQDVQRKYAQGRKEERRLRRRAHALASLRACLGVLSFAAAWEAHIEHDTQKAIRIMEAWQEMRDRT